MRSRHLMILVVAAGVAMGCSANSLKSHKDDSWARVSQSLPDGQYIYNPSLPNLSTLPDPTVGGVLLGPERVRSPVAPARCILHPFAVLFDYALVRPMYMLTGLAPKWFGLTADDALGYQSHMPELTISKDAPRYRIE